MKEKTAQRDLLFDNLKGFLMLVVMICHAFEFYITWRKVPTLMDTAFFVIYCFHMPFFVFISGYFTKNIEKGKDEAFARFLLPFFLFNIAYYLYKYSINPFAVTDDFLFTPLYTFWYLLCMYLWRVFAKDFKRIRYIIPISFILGLVVGTIKAYDRFLSMSRFFVLLPFFVLGMFTTPEMIKKLRKTIRWPYAVFGIVAAVACALFIYFKTSINYLLNHNSMPYATLGLSLTEGILLRAVLYVIALLFIVSVTVVFPRKKTVFTLPGQRSLHMFIFHSFIWELIPLINRLSKNPWLGNTWQNALILIVVATLGWWLLSLPVFEILYGYISAVLTKLVLKKAKE